MEDKERECFVYSVIESLVCFREQKYADSDIHLENAKRSLGELQRLKNAKEMDRQVEILAEHIKSIQVKEGEFHEVFAGLLKR